MYISNFLFKQKSLVFFIFLFLIFANLPVNAATMVVSKNFDSSNLGGFVNSGNWPTVEGKVAKFTLTRNMKTSYRTEAKLEDKKGHFDFNKEYWIGMDYQYVDWDPNTGTEIAPLQVHTRASDWSKKCHTGSAHATAPFLMDTKGNKARFLTFGGKVLWQGAIQRKQWLNIIVHFKISSGNDGFIEVWKDGVKLGRVNGANSNKNDPCGKTMRTPFFKMGVYNYLWRTKATEATRRELWIDNLKIAEGSNGYSLVNSGSAPAPKPEVAKPAPKPEVAKPAPKPVAAEEVNLKPTNVRPPNPGIKKKLVAHWLMDSATGTSIVDRSGYGHEGKLVNGAKVITDEGIKFDGVDDYLNVGKLNITGSAVTVGTWFWANDLSNCEKNDCRIISKATGISEQDHYFMVSTIK
ncbi:MAG: heparin lyase I family protein, partial [Cellulophaga sp.]